MKRLLALLALLIVPLAAAAARAETMIAAMSAHQVQITSNYTGSQLTVFELVERETGGRWRARQTSLLTSSSRVRGPRRMLLVRQKEQCWTDLDQPDAAPLPGQPDLPAHVASSRPILRG